MSAPMRVSVCIPARDQCRYLPLALASALAQDVDGLEVLVHDDGSADDTPEVVAGFRDARVRYRRHPEPIGVAENRNSCLAAARGTAIAWLDADDERLPGSLARQLAVLDEHPSVALVHGGHDVIDADGRALPAWPAPFAQETIEPSATAFGHLIAANELATSTVVARRSAHDDAGPFAAQIGASSTDWEMWLRLALRGDVAYLPGPIARYRRHAGTISHATTADGERLRCNARVVERVLATQRDRIADPQRVAATAAAALAAQALLQAGDFHTRGDRGAALAALATAERAVPSVELAGLREATRAGDDAGSMRLTRLALGALAADLEGTRYGERLRRLAAGDAAWEGQLARAGEAVSRATPPDAVIAAIAKWDPAVVDGSGREGCNYPDRRLLPDGYPRDGTAAVAHLEELRAARGVTHVVVPAVSDWWLEHYPELARRLGAPVWRDDDCRIFGVAEPA